MMNNVYVLLHIDYDSYSVLGVISNRERAIELAKEYCKKNKTRIMMYSLSIDSFNTKESYLDQAISWRD